MERVLAEAGGVGRVGEPAAVVADVEGADGEEGVALRELVAVEEDFFRRVGIRSCGCAFFIHGLAAVDGVLQALFGAVVVPVRAVAEGNRDVSLLDVAEHLGVELVAERSERGGLRLGVAVLGFEVGDDLGIVLVAEPGVVVDEGLAVDRGLGVNLFGDGRKKVGHGFFSVEGRGD